MLRAQTAVIGASSLCLGSGVLYALAYCFIVVGSHVLRMIRPVCILKRTVLRTTLANNDSAVIVFYFRIHYLQTFWTEALCVLQKRAQFWHRREWNTASEWKSCYKGITQWTRADCNLYSYVAREDAQLVERFRALTHQHLTWNRSCLIWSRLSTSELEQPPHGTPWICRTLARTSR